ncbi:class I SAM-dependent methyltransferase [Adonisia turfae]|nr:class I SAM-dependent methyltransferase [Adonisia turfae]
MTSLTNAEVNRANPQTFPSTSSQPILIDTHVHIYDCFNIDTFLDSAWQNFHSQTGHQAGSTGVLLLTESKSHNWFQALLTRVGESSHRWTFHPTAETLSLRATDTQGRTLYLVAGRQIVTAEKLEVAALICDRTFPDGLSTQGTIEAIQAAGGIAVLPWGVGKWVGKRGNLITHLLQQKSLSPLFLGDNSGRPQFWLRPPYFSQVEQQGRPVLLGTDPLPLNLEVSRPGRYGLMRLGEFDGHKPGHYIKSSLLNPAVSWQPYGSLETPWHFMRNQIALRVGGLRGVPLRGRVQPSPPPPMAIQNTLAPDGFPETADIETSSEDYASRFAGAIGEWLLQVQEAATLKMLAAYPGAKVLDVGGGHGQLTKVLIEQGYDVTVLGSAEICKARIQTYLDQGQCAFQVGNVLDMPYSDNAFDVVISYRFLAHVTQWQQFLRELTRVAGKAVIVDYPTVRSVNAIAPALFKFKKGLEGNTRPFVCYHEQEIIDHCESIGWHPSQRYAQFFWPMVLHRTLGKPKVSSLLEQAPRLLGLTRLLGSPVIAKFQKR